MAQPEILAFVMAGGEGSRLQPLTMERPKPALSFGGAHRIIDFVLSNLHHSRIHQVYVLLQYQPRVLLDHIARSWATLPGSPGGFVAPVLPDAMRGDCPAFLGTAHAVYQCLDLVDRHTPDLIAVFAADHVYRMDVRQMVGFHMECSADATVAAVRVPVASASGFGILCCDADQRVREFYEKPRRATPMAGDARFAFASMGNYLFRPSVLVQALEEMAQRGETDFGQHVLPRMIHRQKVYAYDFARNRVPGVTAQEEPGYWRDVGSIESYMAAHRDLLGPQPHFRLDNPEWPILCGSAAGSISQGRVLDSIVGLDSVVTGATVRHSVLERGVVLEPGARVEDCVVMEDATIRRGARLRHALVGARAVIASRSRIGYDGDADRACFSVTSAGTVVIAPPMAVDKVASPSASVGV